MKKTVIIILLAAVFASLLAVHVFGESSGSMILPYEEGSDGTMTFVEYLPGDVDGNGVINMQDVLRLCQYYVDGCKYDPDGYGVTLSIGRIHTVETVAEIAPTCTDYGNIEYRYCTTCKKCFSDTKHKDEISQEDTVIPALGHDFEATYTTSETEHWRKCSRCDAVKDKAVHKWDDGVVTTPATETTSGVMTYTCAVCGATKTEFIPATVDHNYGEWIAEVPATCTENGTKGHYLCSHCGEYFDETFNVIDDLTILSTGEHNYGEWQTISSPTCVNGGIEARQCANCGVYDRRNLSALGHDYGEWIINKAVTCTTNGERVRTCSVCNISQRETLYSPGHQYGDWVTVKEATCEKGFEERTCSVCGKVERNWLPADYTSHVWGEETCTVCGEHKASEGLQYEVINGDEIAIWGYTGSDTTVYLPSSYIGCVVTTIRAEAFKNQTQITGIVIPESITSVASTAFSGCTNIQSATIPTWCIGSISKDKLKAVVLNGGTSIRDYAFQYCRSLTSIEIPASVTSIGNQAFYYCSSLTSITFAENSQLTSIGSYAFYECRSLTSIEIPASVTSIGYRAFYFCSSLTTSIKIPASVTSIGDDAFCYCSSLTSIEIPSSVTSIGDWAFGWCSSLTSIDIPASVTSIGDGAFYECSSLTSIEIPASVTSIGNEAFYKCSYLYRVINNSDLNLTFGSSDNGYVAYYAKIIVDKNGNAIYINDDTRYIVTDGEFLFREKNNTYTLIAYLGNEETVLLPESIEGNNYFVSNMRGVRNVIISEGVTSIGDYAFYNCISLMSIEIPSSVTSIGDYAFRGCSSLTSIEIPSSVTSIGDYAFEDCGSLTSIKVAEGNTVYHSAGNCIIKTASKTLIAGCKNSVIPTDGSVTSIGIYAFGGCRSLTSIEIPASVTSIGNYAFYNCSSLTSINYTGTKAQWNAISKGGAWNSSTGNYTVYCTDGNIAK